MNQGNRRENNLAQAVARGLSVLEKMATSRRLLMNFNDGERLGGVGKLALLERIASPGKVMWVALTGCCLTDLARCQHLAS